MVSPEAAALPRRPLPSSDATDQNKNVTRNKPESYFMHISVINSTFRF